VVRVFGVEVKFVRSRVFGSLTPNGIKFWRRVGTSTVFLLKWKDTKTCFAIGGKNDFGGFFFLV
jgi:hypothetical protein